MTDDLPGLSRRLIEIGRRFDARGWVLGTSGNFSAVLSRDPLKLVITASGSSKGDLIPEQILEIDGTSTVTGARTGKPSAEARLHV